MRYPVFQMLLCCLLLVSGAAACRKTRPQLPSNKPVHTTGPQLDLTEVNREMARREDSLITAYVRTHAPEMQKMPGGYWYKVERSAKGARVKTNDMCSVRYRLYSLAGQPLDEATDKELVVGKKQVITGLDYALPSMQVGEEGLFIFPSHLAYGMKGYGQQVPPYTPVMYRVEVLGVR